MFHIGRSGSTVLADLLNQHQKVYWNGEIYAKTFEHWERKGFVIGVDPLPVDFTRLLRKKMIGAGEKIYGFEVKFFHLKLINVELTDYIESLHEFGFNHFIVLKRKNYLRKIVSSVIAHQKSQFHQSYHEKANLTRIKLDVDNIQIDFETKPLLAYLQNYHEKFCLLEQLLEGRNSLQLTYEDDIASDPLVSYKRVCDFLQVSYKDVLIRYGKTNPFELSEIIINFEEVERRLCGTSFEWMLYE
jgi:hypothetical protein